VEVHEKVIRAWQEAGAALGIEVITPFEIETDEGTLQAGTLIVGFGSPKGTLIGPMELGDFEHWSDSASRNGYYFSMLNPKSYSKFDRKQFEETLNDWSWQGDPDRCPSWYTGQPWSD
jgi:hypothetical protein